MLSCILLSATRTFSTPCSIPCTLCPDLILSKYIHIPALITIHKHRYYINNQWPSPYLNLCFMAKSAFRRLWIIFFLFSKNVCWRLHSGNDSLLSLSTFHRIYALAILRDEQALLVSHWLSISSPSHGWGSQSPSWNGVINGALLW